MTSDPLVVVLDDDPTGSQDASDVPILLTRDPEALRSELEANGAVYLLTNTRALPEADAVALVRDLSADAEDAETALGRPVLLIQRGDSTLRGHVFAEIDAVRRPGDRVVFAPAFPAGGRRTVDGIHLVRIDDDWVNAADTEFARDPVFGYSERTVKDYVRAHGDRDAVTCAPSDLRSLLEQDDDAVLVPDIRTDDDVVTVAAAVRARLADGHRVLVRSAAPLAAELARVRSRGPVDLPAMASGPILVVAGSHTEATTRQLASLHRTHPALVEIPAADSIRDPERAADAATAALLDLLRTESVVTLATSRVRDEDHDTLDHGARVMDALTAAVSRVSPMASAVIAKGGITSAEVARRGLGATRARVVGQLAPGISLWAVPVAGRTIPYVVVPGNMGDAATLVGLADRLVHRSASVSKE